MKLSNVGRKGKLVGISIALGAAAIAGPNLIKLAKKKVSLKHTAVIQNAETEKTVRSQPLLKRMVTEAELKSLRSIGHSEGTAPLEALVSLGTMAQKTSGQGEALQELIQSNPLFKKGKPQKNQKINRNLEKFIAGGINPQRVSSLKIDRQNFKVNSGVELPGLTAPETLSPQMTKNLGIGSRIWSALSLETEEVECTPITLDTPTGADTATDLFTERTTDVETLAGSLGSVEAITNYVRTEVKFLPRFGAAQTADQVLRSHVGTAADKATLLIALLRAENIPAQYLAGDMWVDESTLKNLYGVEGAYDLAWAQEILLHDYLSGKPEVSQIVEGTRYWVIPHVWVYAQVGSTWTEIDPTYVRYNYTPSEPLLWSSSLDLTHDFLLGPDSEGVFVKNYTLIDFLMNEVDRSSLSDMGYVNQGIDVKTADGSDADVARCTAAQFNAIPSGYQFTSHIEVVDDEETSLVEAALPLAEMNSHRIHLSMDSGLFTDTGETTGTLELRADDAVIDSASSVTSGEEVEVIHSLQAPSEYGGAINERTTPGMRLGDVQVITHSIVPVSQADLEESVRETLALRSEDADQRDQMAGLLEVASSLALVRSAENDRDIGMLRGVHQMSESLLIAASISGSVLDSGANDLGAVPGGAVLDWSVSGPIYSRTGDYEELGDYSNTVLARGDQIISSSSVEHKTLQELYGIEARSAVEIIQSAASANTTLDPPVDIIEGDQLTSATESTLIGRLGTGMTDFISVLEDFTAEEPYLYSLTESYTPVVGDPMNAFIVLPSTVTGRGGAYATHPDGALLLAGFVGRSFSYRTLVGTSPYITQIWETCGFYNNDYWYCGISIINPWGSRSRICYTPSGLAPQIPCTGSPNLDVPAPTSSYNPSLLATGCCRESTGCPSNYPMCPTGTPPSGAYCLQTGGTPMGDQFGSVFNTAGICYYPTIAGWENIPEEEEGETHPQTFAGNDTTGAQGNPQHSPNGFSECPGNPVNVSSGSMWHQFTDFEVKGRTAATGIPFIRTYLAQPTTEDGDLGSHWAHNWETRLYSQFPGGEETLPDIMWIDEHGGGWRFRRLENESLESPAGFFGTLTEFEDRYELRKKGGVILTFSRTLSGVPIGRLATITEPHGETVTLDYDTNNRLESITTALAGTVSFTRDTEGKIIEVSRDRDSLDYTFEYDTEDRLISSVDFDENETTYEYNEGQEGTAAHGLLSAFEDPIGRRTEFTYYDNGKAYEQFEPGDASWSFQYSAGSSSSGNYTRVRGVEGEATEYRFDSFKRTQEVITSDGGRTRKLWSDRNEVIATIDELGFRTEYEYDARGNLTGIQKPEDSDFTEFTYDTTFDHLTSVNPLEGSTTTFTLDSETGDVTQMSRVLSSTTLSLDFENDDFGNVISIDNGPSTYEHETNSNGLYTEIFDARNPETRTYDSRGRVSTRSWSSGRSITYTYDDFDRVTAETDSHGPDVSKTYDEVGRLLTRTVTDGTTNQITEYEWDARDRLITLTQPNGDEIHYTYDRVTSGCRTLDQPTAITDPAGRVTRIEYDKRQRLTRVTDPRGGVTRFEYNLRGDRVGLTDAEGNRTKFVYDGNRRLIRQERPSVRTNSSNVVVASSEVIHYNYDDAGKLIRQEKESAAGGDSEVIELTYDDLDRVVRREQKREDGGVSTATQDDSSFTYQSILDAKLYASADNNVAELDFTYETAPPYRNLTFSIAAATSGNPLNLYTGTYTITPAQTDAVASVSDPSSNTMFTKSYDAAGRLTGISSTYYANQGIVTALTYDGFGRKSTVTHDTTSYSATAELVGNYTYDVMNRITGITWEGQANPHTSYDEMSESITYNSDTGNIDQIVRELGTFTYTHDLTDQLTEVSFADNTSDGITLPSSLVNRSWTYDLTGNRLDDAKNGSGTVSQNFLTENSVHKYFPDEDGFGNVKKRFWKSNSAVETMSYRADGKMTAYERSTFVVDYYYDALGRRVAKKVTYNSETPFIQNFLKFSDQDQTLIGRQGDGYAYVLLDGQGVDEHLGKIYQHDGKGFVTDHLGSVLNSTAGGNKKAFSPWGELLISDSGIAPWSDPLMLSFTGAEYNLENKTLYRRARDYNPDTGTWLSVDPIGFESGDTNLHNYVSNKVVNLADPFGLKIVDMTGGHIPWEVKSSPLYDKLDKLPNVITIQIDNSIGGYGVTSFHDRNNQTISINSIVHPDRHELIDTFIHELGHANINILTNGGTSADFDHKYIIPPLIDKNINSCPNEVKK